MRLKKFLILLSFFLIQSLFAQFKLIDNNPFKFKHINDQQGLFHNTILSVIQDNEGFIWLGTTSGLYKYDGYRFKSYKYVINDSRSVVSNNISALYETKDGILWVGTKNGMSLYNSDKDDFVSFDGNDLPLIQGWVTKIFEDSRGYVWLGMHTKTILLKKVDGHYKVIKTFKVSGPSKEITSKHVSDIVEDNFGNIWIATGRGLNKLSPIENNQFEYHYFFHDEDNPASLSSSSITSLLSDGNTLWIGTRNGLNEIDIRSTRENYYFRSYKHNPNDEKSLSDSHIVTLLKDHKNRIWIGTKNGGLNMLYQNRLKFLKYQKNLFNPYCLKSNHIYTLFKDRSDVLWVGTIRGGLSKLDLNQKQIAHFFNDKDKKQSLSGNIINQIYEDSKGNIWVNTFDGGLNMLNLDGNKIKFDHFKNNPKNTNSLSSDQVFSMVEDNFGNYWVATKNFGINHIKLNGKNKLSVNRYHTKSKDFAFPTNQLGYLFKDHKGDIWVASIEGSGLIKFEPNDFGKGFKNIKQYKNNPNDEQSIPSNTIITIFEDSNNVLWLGTDGQGIIKVVRDRNNNPVRYIQIKSQKGIPTSLSSNYVFSFHEDQEKNMWIATYGGGLYFLSNDQKSKIDPIFENFTEKDGLANDEVYAVLEDDKDNLWLSTNGGISKFNKIKKEFSNLQVSDGLQNSNYRKLSYLKDSKGLLYFGGINGFNVFYPNDFKENKKKPQVAITDFKIFNRSVEVGEAIDQQVLLKKNINLTNQLVLKHEQNVFAFEFASLHFVSPKQNKYSYILEGFDEDWNYIDSKIRVAQYSNLDPGKYVFKLRASNNDNYWTDVIKEIELEVLPPFWRTWYAYLTYTLLIVFLMFLFRRYILINEEYQNKLTIEKLEQQKIKEINKMKLEFFTNISHEFKTPLTLIIGPLQSLINNSNLDKPIKKSLMMMERNANHLFRLINQVMEFRKVENKELKLKQTKGHLVSFFEDMVDSFIMLAANKQILFEFKTKEEEIEVFFDWDKLEKIVNNLVSNSIKYTESKGEISLIIAIENSQTVKGNKKIKERTLKIIVKDTGIGIPANQLAFIFDRFYQIDSKDRSSSLGSGVGLALTKALIELHQGNIIVKSEEGVGSEFIVHLPLIEVLDTQNKSKEEIIKTEENVDSYHEFNEEKLASQESNPLLLVVEDNPDMQEFIKDSLSSKYRIIQAFNGNEGLKLAQDSVPDLIISDVMMPEKDGIALCSELKALESTSHIPVILLTARASVNHKIEGLEVGADAYIPKPFELRHLLARIQNLLEQRELLKNKYVVITEPIKDSQTTLKKGLKKSELEFLEKAEAVVEKNLTNSQFNVEDLGRELAFSRMQLYRKLKSLSGLSANEFIREYRIKKAAQLFRETELNTTEVLDEIGMTNRSYFAKCFKKMYDMNPKDYANLYK